MILQKALKLLRASIQPIQKHRMYCHARDGFSCNCGADGLNKKANKWNKKMRKFLREIE